MTNEEVLKRIKGGLIVSCQALSTEPLCDPYIMSMMAYAAKEGGAVGIRANTTVDIEAIKKKVDLPIIGIIKKDYEGSDVYITPTEKEVEELVRTGVDIIAVDATKRMRPGNITFEEFFKIYAVNIRISFLWPIPHALKRGKKLWSSAAIFWAQLCAAIPSIQRGIRFRRLI